MNHRASLDYLDSFQNFERMHLAHGRRVWDLKAMRLLLRRAGHPEKKYFRVLIAGTKGKGSTGFFLESFLESAGIRTGFYSSPHIEDPRERIRIGGKMISVREWCRAAAWVRGLLAKDKAPSYTYFEIMTLMAAQVFKQAGVQVGIFEVGLGGRFDATNALGAQMSVLTPVHLDHEALLGPTIGKIAAEKAAIIRPGTDVITGPQRPDALRAIQTQVRRQKAVLWKSRPFKGRLPLSGDFQRANAGTAQKAFEILEKKHGFRRLPGRSPALASKNWEGRLESCGGFLFDAAHNPVSVEALARNLKNMKIRDPLVIFGTSRDKKSDLMLKALSKACKDIILTPTPHSRSQQLGTLMAQAKGLFARVFPAAGISEAVSLALKIAERRKIVVTGSFFILGPARRASRA